VAAVVFTPTAAADLARLIGTHSLPDSTRERVKRSLAALGRFPRLGAQLAGRWSAFRFVLGPWRWMIVVYAYDESADRVSIVTIRDARTASAATTESRDQV